MGSHAARAKSLVERHGGQGKAPWGLWRARTGLPDSCTPCWRQPSRANGPTRKIVKDLLARSDGLARAAQVHSTGAAPANFDGPVSRKKAHIISNAYAGMANLPRLTRATSSRGVLLPSRSHRITFPDLNGPPHVKQTTARWARKNARMKLWIKDTCVVISSKSPRTA
jgi:hypothetical protein